MHDALGVAETGDEIWVAQGVYKPDRGTGDRLAFYNVPAGITIYGGFAGDETSPDQRNLDLHETILSGDLNGDNGPQDCESQSNCCSAHVGSGCDDAACEAIVCNRYDDCCFDRFNWNEQMCVSTAKELCCGLGGWNRCDDSLRIIVVDEPGDPVTLDGLTIEATFQEAIPTRREPVPAGVTADGVALTINHCTFRDLQTYGIYSSDGTLHVVETTFVDCSVVSIEAVRDGRVELLRSSFQNSAGVSCTLCGLFTITECSFVAMPNTRPINADLTDLVLMSRCVIEGDVRDPRACAVLDNSLSGIDRCSFSGCNSGILIIRGAAVVSRSRVAASSGGIAARTAALVEVSNCVLTGNLQGIRIFPDPVSSIIRVRSSTIALNSFGGVLADNGLIQIVNSIVWGNGLARQRNRSPEDLERSQINSRFDGAVEVNHSLVEGWTGRLGGVGNFDGDPMFIDVDGSDNVLRSIDANFRLRPGSPAFDRGDNTELGPDFLDLDGDGDREEPLPVDFAGRPRVVDGVVDLGAYEGLSQSFVIDRKQVTIPEGSGATIAVWMAVPPVDALDAVVSIEQARRTFVLIPTGGLHPEPLTLHFDSENYDSPQFVRVLSLIDADAVNDRARLRLSTPGMPPQEVIFVQTDRHEVPARLYVSKQAAGRADGTNWSDALPELRDALALAKERGGVSEIWVASGVYKPTEPNGSRSATFFLSNGLRMYGGFAGHETSIDQRDPGRNVTILSGDLNGDDLPFHSHMQENSDHVLTAIGTTADTLVDGFVIEGGNANPGVIDWPAPNEDRFFSNTGGGLLFHNGGLHLRDCVFRNNISILDGGGIWVSFGSLNKEATAPLIIDRCSFLENFAGSVGGGAFIISMPLRVSNSLFTGNVAFSFGGGIVVQSMKFGIFEGTTVVHNQQGGAVVSPNGSGPCSIRNSPFLGEYVEV